jgi:hypothetical protein
MEAANFRSWDRSFAPQSAVIPSTSFKGFRIMLLAQSCPPRQLCAGKSSALLWSHAGLMQGAVQLDCQIYLAIYHGRMWYIRTRSSLIPASCRRSILQHPVTPLIIAATMLPFEDACIMSQMRQKDLRRMQECKILLERQVV